MCYLIAKDIHSIGCIALRTNHGAHLAEYKRKLLHLVADVRIQLVTISRPSAYGECAPYRFVETEEKFTKAVLAM